MSTQGNSSSLVQHPDSGIGESSPEPEVFSQSIEKDGIVPDSQSPPGSSSYIPTTSTTLDGIVARQTPLESEVQRSVLSSDNIHPRDKSSGPGPNEGPVAFEDSIEDSLILEVAASQPSPHSLRSRSEPPPSSTESWSSPSRSRCPSLLRSKSDFAASYHDQVQCHEGSVARERRRAQKRRQRPDNSSTVSRSHSQQDHAFREDPHISSGAQVSHSTIPVSHQCSKVDNINSQQNYIFQTQVPSVPTSQGTRTSAESAGTFKHTSNISKEPPSVDIPS